jgi:hypothetical protein
MIDARAPSILMSLAYGCALSVLATPASAQLHWDASAQAGMMKRVMVDRPDGGRDAGFGPVGQLTGHVALLPLVRLGGYFGHDISPIIGDVSARDLTWGGVRAKIMSPWPRGDLRAWLFVGFGYTGVYARSSARAGAVIHGAGGGFFELPFGIGASYKIRKPWELCAELGTRVGFAHHGSAYEDPGPRLTTPGSPDANAKPSGTDRYGIGLTIGVLLDL